MANLADLTIGLGVDDKLTDTLDDAGRKVETFADKVSRQSQKLSDVGTSMQDVGKKMSLFATLPIAGGFAKATGEAEDLNESINAINVTFGDAAEGVLGLSEAAATTVGLSQSEFNGLAVQFSSFADTLAGESGDIAGVLGEMTGRASDFASVMNLDVNEAARLFQSGLAGETEPLKKYGINLSAAAVEAHALEKGITDNAGAMTEAEKIQARYSLLMEQTAKTQGDFANTSDQSANAQRIAAARAKNLAAEFGQNLIPVKVKVLELASGLLDRFNAMSPTMKTAAVVVAGVVAAMGPLVWITGSLLRTMGQIGQATAKVIGWFTAKSTAATTSAATEAAAANTSKTSVVRAIGAKIAAMAKWVATTVAAGAKAAAQMAVTAAKFVAHYVKMAAVALAQAARMAASWVIAMGPVGWVIAAVVGLVALIIANWDKVVEWTRKAWEWVSDKVASAWRWIVDTTRNAVNGVVTWFTNLRDRAVSTVRGMWDSVVQFFRNLKADAIRLVGELVTGYVNLVLNLRDRVVSIFTGLRDRVVGTIEALMDRVRGIKDAVLGFFSSAGSWLLEAGKNIIRGLINGIKNMIPNVGGVMNSVVSSVRDRLPFSPAKKGPLSGRGNPELAGSKIVSMVADGMGSQVGQLSRMADRAAAAALPNLGVPSVRLPGVSASRSGLSGAAGAAATTPVVINVSGSVVSERELVEVVQRGIREKERRN